MVKWIEYTRSDEQLESLASAKTAVRVRYINGTEVNWACVLFKQRSREICQLQNAVAYLISEPHPYAGIIKIWADTGCEVYVRITSPGNKDEFPELAEYIESIEHTETYVTDKPNWNIHGAEYRLTPFED